MTPNIDFLCVIRENAGKTAFETEDIPASVELVSKLEGMVDNENQTVLDMGAELNCYVPTLERRTIDYVSPHNYNASFIDNAIYPHAGSFSDYQKSLSEERERLMTQFAAQNEFLCTNDFAKYREALDEYIDKRLKDYEKDLKRDFLRVAKRFILAFNYTMVLRRVKAEKDVRMYSTDTHGNSTFKYKVTEDIDILVETNFCYGSASFFRLVVRYKGIEILPYSFIVRYYFANLRDLKRYTRRYETKHDSWNTAFKFVEKTANLASSSPKDFLTVWVLNEVKEMVRGLHTILEDPRFSIQDWVNKTGEDTDCDYLTVRNMHSGEKRCFSVYPEEMTMAVQAEKITGALEFLENLSALAALIPDIDGFISEIKDMAVSIIPKLDAMVVSLDVQLSDLKERKGEKEVANEALDTTLRPHRDAISDLFETRSGERKEWSRSDFESEYGIAHPEYKEMCDQRQKLFREIFELSNEISQRDGFRRSLLECRKKVERADLIEAHEDAA